MRKTELYLQKYRALKSEGKLVGTIKAAMETRSKREALRFAAPPMLSARLLAYKAALREDLTRRTSLVPIGALCVSEIRRTEPRKQNWRQPAALPSLGVSEHVVTCNAGRYSSRCTYTKYEYIPSATSLAVIDKADSRLIRYWYGSDKAGVILKLPRGFRWSIDHNGLHVESASDKRNDYHPDSDDLRWFSPAKLIGKLKAHAVQRAEATRRAKAEARKVRHKADQEGRMLRLSEREGARVCVADALAAGNCRAGVNSFAVCHSLDTARHYRPSELLAIANGDAGRVKLTVAVALRRHRREMAAGVCLLADHAA